MSVYRSRLNDIIRNFKVVEDFGRQLPLPTSKTKAVMVKVECVHCGSLFEGQYTHFKFGGRECLKCFPKKWKVQKDYTGEIHGNFKIVKDPMVKEPGKARRVTAECLDCSKPYEQYYFSFKNLRAACECKSSILKTPDWIRIRKIYLGMVYRCHDEKAPNYYNYGSKGIVVCEEWRKDKRAFYDWSIKNGYNSTLTIDRIDNNKGYAPNNCRWATMIEQGRNKKMVMPIEIAKEIKNLLSLGITHKEIARLTKISHHAISNISKGSCWAEID